MRQEETFWCSITGPGAHQRLLEAGYSASDVTHFFLTHYHYDHLMDYPRLLLTRWDHSGTDLPSLEVFGPCPLHTINERIVGPSGLFSFDIAARIKAPASKAVFRARGGTGDRPRPVPKLREVAPGDVVEKDGWVGPSRASASRATVSRMPFIPHRDLAGPCGLLR